MQEVVVANVEMEPVGTAVVAPHTHSTTHCMQQHEIASKRLGVLTNWFLMDVTKSSGRCGARRGHHRGGHSGCSTTFCALWWCNVSEC